MKILTGYYIIKDFYIYQKSYADGIWAHNQKAKNYGQHLAQQVSIGFSIDSTYGV